MFLSLIDSSDPIDFLINEHDAVMKQLNLLSDAVNTVRRTGYSFRGYEKIVESVRLLSVEVIEHNRKEEKYLFPLLERHTRASLYQMRKEHRELLSVFDQALRSAQTISEEERPGRSISELTDVSLELIYLLGEHVAHEGNMIFPLAKQVLSREEYGQFRDGIMSSVIHDG